MIACIVISGIISIFSVFAFFGDAFSNTGGIVIPNMFDLMFGLTKTYLGYSVQWKQYTGMTILFVLQMLIILVALISFVRCYHIYIHKSDESIGVALSVALMVLSAIAMILSFCTLNITNINDGGGPVKLGWGPILYSVLHILVIVLLLVGIIVNTMQPVTKQPQTKSVTQSPAVVVSPKTPIDENQKADLILKYKKMMDEGVITQEEFETKKKELLK